MTKVLDDLERRRWIERRRDPDDRRMLRVHLTSAGQRAAADAASRYVRLAADLVRPLRSADLAAFTRICAGLYTAGNALHGNSPGFPPNPGPP
jgi:DNA-binding MarR family transcriptional regulator